MEALQSPFCRETSQSIYREGALLSPHSFMKPLYRDGCFVGHVTYLAFMTQEFLKISNSQEVEDRGQSLWVYEQHRQIASKEEDLKNPLDTPQSS